MHSTSFSNAGNNLQAPPVICLMGATATGKTDLAVEIAKRFAVELISVDSALVYRDMDIGTAKPEAELLTQAPHFLIDIIDAAQSYSAWQFIDDAGGLIRQINQRGNTALLVGGTMMYFHAFEQGLNRLPEADDGIRSQLDAEAQTIGWTAMHAQLADLDPQTAERVEPGDAQRIQRALEVFRISGKTLSQLQAEKSSGYAGEIHKILLHTDNRPALHARIENRFHAMLEQGFVAEVENLKRRGDLELSMPSMRCVGYRQVWQYLDNQFERTAMIDKAIAATRQLAKRQITWLRKQPQNYAVNCLNYEKDAIFKGLSKFLKTAD